MAALVPRDLDVVDQNDRAVIDRTEVQQQTLHLRSIEDAPVPHHVAWQLADP